MRSSRTCRHLTKLTCTAGRLRKRSRITFDDGPDPTWTPKILDMLQGKNAKATFFLIGVEVEKYPAIAKRIYNEGHEIGNHTFTHPDISTISKRYFEVELSLTERLFEGKLGVKPVLIRPPYPSMRRPTLRTRCVRWKWRRTWAIFRSATRLTPTIGVTTRGVRQSEIANDVLPNLPPCVPANLRCGNIILLHDGGGDRRQTVKALGMIIDGLQASVATRS